MANKHMKRCSTYVIRKLQIKTTMGSTTYLLEWPKYKTLTTANVDENREQQELSFFAGGKAKWYSYFERWCLSQFGML